MSNTNAPVLYRNEHELTQLRARIIEAENEFAAGLGIDITDVDPVTFARELLEEAERLGIEAEEPSVPEHAL